MRSISSSWRNWCITSWNTLSPFALWGTTHSTVLLFHSLLRLSLLSSSSLIGLKMLNCPRDSFFWPLFSLHFSDLIQSHKSYKTNRKLIPVRYANNLSLAPFFPLNSKFLSPNYLDVRKALQHDMLKTKLLIHTHTYTPAFLIIFSMSVITTPFGHSDWKPWSQSCTSLSLQHCN